MKRGVIFDMDGVLVDNSQAHLLAFLEFAKRHSVPLTAERFLPLFGRGNDEIIPAIVGPEIVDKYGIAALAYEKEAIYREIYSPDIIPIAGLAELLHGLRERDVVCAVGSSGPYANVEFVLGRCGIADCFSAVVSGDDVTRCKPDPEIYLRAADRLGLAASDCVVFEDSLSGIRSAEAAGMPVVAVATTCERAILARQPAVRLIVDDYTSLSAESVTGIS